MKNLLIILFLVATAFIAGVLPLFTNQNRDLYTYFGIHLPLNSDTLWSLVQDWRVKNNLKSYIKDQRLCEIAKIRVHDVESDWSHVKFNDIEYRTIYFQPLAPTAINMGENLARNYASESETLNNWLNSPSHLKNLQASFSHSCIVTDGSYATQIFANF